MKRTLGVELSWNVLPCTVAYAPDVIIRAPAKLLLFLRNLIEGIEEAAQQIARIKTVVCKSQDARVQPNIEGTIQFLWILTL